MQDSDNAEGVVVDTYAWIEYFRGSEEGIRAKKFIDSGQNLFTPSIVIGELSDKYRREKIEEWKTRKKFIKVKTKMLLLDDNVADQAGSIKQRLRKKYRGVSLADAIIAAHSAELKARILTGDKHLTSEKNAINIAAK